MKSLFKEGLIAAVLLLSFNSAHTQAQQQWEWTKQMLGNWHGPATILLGDQSFNVNYHMHFKSAVNGNAITMDEWFNHKDLGSFKGTNLIGLSSTTGLIHWFSVDNFGTAHEHTGEWSDSKHFRMEYQTMIEGQLFLEIIDFILNANNTKMEAELEVFLDGTLVQAITGTLVKSNNNNANNANNNKSVSTTIPQAEIKIYPNPTSRTVIIESQEIMDEIIVANETGQIVYTARPEQSDFSFDVERSGTYRVQIVIGGSVVNKKLIVKN